MPKTGNQKIDNFFYILPMCMVSVKSLVCATCKKERNILHVYIVYITLYHEYISIFMNALFIYFILFK